MTTIPTPDLSLATVRETDRAGRPRTGRAARHPLGSELDGHAVLGHIGPNWFASVMGTGIVATAAATLPIHATGLTIFARVVWVVASTMLVIISLATAGHWIRHPDRARSHLANPIMSHFYGAPAMAMMTVGAGAVLVAPPMIGLHHAVVVDAVLWTAGTALGLWTAVAVPFRAFTQHEVEPDAAFGGWLMPVVPPMVSAATATLLIPHLPVGGARVTLLYGGYALFGITLLASLIMITLLWSRLAQHQVGAAAAVPTLWIVLGPLGQSVTAAHNLGTAAPALLPAPYGSAFHALAVVYGVPIWGFALLWLAIAIAITVRTARRGLPFSLTWWSFTFPVGTMVTGTSGLAEATGLPLFTVAAVVLYAGLLAAWAIVLVRTTRGVLSGRLLRAPSPGVTPRRTGR